MAPEAAEVVLGLTQIVGALPTVTSVGQQLTVLLDKIVEPGRYLLGWNGRLEDGRRAPAGLYFVRATGPGFAQTSKVVMVE